MSNIGLTDEFGEQLLKSRELNKEAWELLGIIVAEWNSDPTSVACFDLRIVNRARSALEAYNKLQNTIK